MELYFDGIKIFKDNCKNFDEERLFFEKNDYVIINDIITDELKKYLFDNISYDKNVLNDKLQFYREHNNSECNFFLSKFLNTIKPFYDLVLKKKLSNFIGFSMKYNKDSELLPHYDNYNMPISSTICYWNEDKIEYPIYIDKSFFNNPHPFRLTVNDKKGIPKINIIKININEGDIVIFRGRNHLHWRDKKDIKDYRAILLHTEDYTYNGNLISYVENSDNIIKANINEVKNINIYGLTDINNYDTFRKNYIMYFNNS